LGLLDELHYLAGLLDRYALLKRDRLAYAVFGCGLDLAVRERLERYAPPNELLLKHIVERLQGELACGRERHRVLFLVERDIRVCALEVVPLMNLFECLVDGILDLG